MGSHVVTGNEWGIRMRRGNSVTWNLVAADQHGWIYPSLKLGTVSVPNPMPPDGADLNGCQQSTFTPLFLYFQHWPIPFFSQTLSFSRCMYTIYPIRLKASCRSHSPPVRWFCLSLLWTTMHWLHGLILRGQPYFPYFQAFWGNASLQLMSTDNNLSKDLEAKVFWAKESITGCGSQVRKHFQKASKAVCLWTQGHTSELESLRGSYFNFKYIRGFTCAFISIRCAH